MFKTLKRALVTATPLKEPPVKGQPQPQGGQHQPGVSVFLTPQSLATFPGATAATMGVWKLWAMLLPHFGKKEWVLAGTALVIGIAILVASVSEPDTKPKNTGQWVMAVVVGLVNTVFLAGASLGIWG